MEEDPEQPPPATIRRVAIKAIIIPEGRRTINPAVVAALAESMAARGLLQPIRVRTIERDEGGPALVAGGHRLEAARSLGWTHIDAVEDEDPDEVRAELIEIDENLIRAELSPAERAMAMARRKAIYETLHPETRQGVAGGRARQGSATDILSFAAATAQAIGKDVRTVERITARGDHIAPDVMKTITHTCLDRGSYIDTLKDLSPAEQRETVQRDLGRRLRQKMARADRAARRDDAAPAVASDVDDDGIPTAEASTPMADTPAEPVPVRKIMSWGWDDPQALVARAADLVGAERVVEMAWEIMEREAGAATAPERPVIDDDGTLLDDTEEGSDVLEDA